MPQLWGHEEPYGRRNEQDIRVSNGILIQPMLSRSNRAIKHSKLNRENTLLSVPSGQARLWRYRRIPTIKFTPHPFN
jgi:hypothetical protein